ncbi:MAG: SDR family oxidoreductase [Candidatus Dadabacteria bacterium]|nr:MAG: SDR family oxidoreductase [Candidatus Dadabacteria bacterium]TDJ01597.1 MAG: SDR family oxidoreductase [Candidatus Dadabacteria bacterium]
MNKNSKFNDQVVVITGASSGIGRATALEFAREGAKTVLVSRSLEKLERVASEIRSFNPNVLAVPTDVSSPEQVHEMVEKVLSELGRIDVLFNNAGSSYVGRIEDENFVENAKKMIDTDYFGTVYTTKEVLPVMQKQGSGHIMNMSSVVGRKAFPHFGGYSSVMHAISGFTDSLRQELFGSGINVSIIHPALTQTPLLNHVRPEDMPPPFRGITPISVESVAKAVVNGVYYNQARIIVPFQPKLLLLADAISPHIGDLVVKLLSNKVFSRLLGTYRGRLYHDIKNQ